MQKLLLIIVILVVCPAWTYTLAYKPGSQELAQGLAARDAGQKAEAVALFRAALATAYHDNIRAKALTELGILSPREEAIPLLTQAAAMGNQKAKLKLAKLKDPPPPPKRDKQRVSKKMHKRVDTRALLIQARTYSAGDGVEYNLTKAYEYYGKAAAAGNAEAQYQLGLAYLQGIGLPKDSVRARHWLTLAAAQGNPLATELMKDLGQ